MGQTIRNQKLNLLKALACFSVVFIHIKFPGAFGRVIASAGGFAVPVFFMTAGYFAFNKDSKTIKRRLIRITYIFIVSYLLYFAFKALLAYKDHGLANWFHTYFNAYTPVKLIVFCSVDFAVLLWYLIAMIEVYLLWLLIISKCKIEMALKFIPILFLLKAIQTTYCETMGLEWFWRINFITSGMPWFLFGYYLHTDKGKTIIDTPSTKLILLSVIGGIITVIPTAFETNLKFGFWGTIPFAIGLFTLALKPPAESICRPLEFIGEKLSLYIYILHSILGSVLGVALKILRVNTDSDIFKWVFPIITLLCTIAASWAIAFVFNFHKETSYEHK